MVFSRSTAIERHSVRTPVCGHVNPHGVDFANRVVNIPLLEGEGYWSEDVDEVLRVMLVISSSSPPLDHAGGGCPKTR